MSVWSILDPLDPTLVNHSAVHLPPWLCCHIYTTISDASRPYSSVEGCACNCSLPYRFLRRTRSCPSFLSSSLKTASHAKRHRLRWGPVCGEARGTNGSAFGWPNANERSVKVWSAVQETLVEAAWSGPPPPNNLGHLLFDTSLCSADRHLLTCSGWRRSVLPQPSSLCLSHHLPTGQYLDVAVRVPCQPFPQWGVVGWWTGWWRLVCQPPLPRLQWLTWQKAGAGNSGSH